MKRERTEKEIIGKRNDEMKERKTGKMIKDKK